MTRVLLFVLAALSMASGGQAAETFRLDPGHHEIGFNAAHFGVCRFGGFFTEATGSLDYDADPSKCSVTFTAQTASLVTAGTERTNALKSAFFLDVENFPTLSFTSTRITGADGKLSVTGNLTIRDVTREVTFDVTLARVEKDPMGKPRIGVLGTLVINRQDYGLKFDRSYGDGTPFVGNEITVSLAAEFIPPAAE